MKIIHNFLNKISNKIYYLNLKKDNYDRLKNYCDQIKRERKSSHWDERDNSNLLKFKNNQIIFDNFPVGFDRKYKYKFFTPSLQDWYEILSIFIKKKISNFARNFTGVGFDEIKHFKKNWPEDKSFFNYKTILDKKKSVLPLKYQSTNTDCFWYFNEIYKYILSKTSEKNIEKKELNFLEIGPGSGEFAILLKKEFNINKFYFIDLAENIPFCFLNIIRIFPKANYLLPNEINNKNFKNDSVDFIFLNSSQADQLEDNHIDVSINTASLSETDPKIIKNYFKILRNCMKEDNLFFNVNRYEKFVYIDKNKTIIRTSDYPYNENDFDYKNEICTFNVGRQLQNMFVRITKLSKNIL